MDDKVITKSQVLRIVQAVLDDKHGTAKDISTALRIARGLGLDDTDMAQLEWSNA